MEKATKGKETILLFNSVTSEQEGASPAEIWEKSLPSRGTANAKALGWEQAWHAQEANIKESG